MQDLNVTLIQTELDWENIPANLSRFEKLVQRIEADTDLIVLPEMFSTGFSMNADRLAETMQGDSPAWMRAASEKLHTDMVASIMIREDDRFYNRLLWAKPEGELIVYDKRHLFRMTGEHDVYTSGDQNVLAELKGWKIRPFICYDLRFPAWTRNKDKRFDLALFIANWPAARSKHWKILLQARAIENQVYVVGVNRIGADGNGVYHSGDSSVIDPIGNILFQTGHSGCIRTVRLDGDVLQDYRRRFPAWKDGDRFELT
jgi:predicted amidohydrolase